jgi:xanthine dehydrogenase YagR molybdenum-binding subunit
MSIRPDGQVRFQTPIVENGAGALTVSRQLVAEEFGIPLETVSVIQSVEGIEVDRGVGGSRTTRLVGKVIGGLASKLKARLADLVAAEFGLGASDVAFERGSFVARDGRRWPLAKAASLASSDLVEQLTHAATNQDRAFVFMAQAAEVRVDRDTGAVEPLRLVSVHEVGRIVNPMLFETQIAGGVLQGLGYALMEGLHVEGGRVVNTNLHEYKIPTMADLPKLETILLGPDVRLGLTPIGEGANAGMAPAIVNAVVEVIGAEQPLDIPLQPETILELCASRRPAGAAVPPEASPVPTR